MNDKVGILYFSQSPDEEAIRKNWTNRSKSNLKIALKLYHHTLDIIKDTKIPYQISSGTSQIVKGFGSNISNAVSHFFKEDYDHVIVIGNDCPDIKQSDIIAAHNNILKGNHTLGLTKDGGTYLFSLSKKQWDAKSFESLPWCTEQLGKALEVYLSAFSKTQSLETKSDIDTLKNLNHFIQSTYSRLATLLKQLVSICANYAYTIPLIFSATSQTHSKRGPPIIHI